MYRLKYRIKTISPVLISSMGGDMNMVSTKDYIPGTTILGIFAARYVKEKNKLNNNVHEDETFYNWFLNGKLKFSNAYLTIYNEETEIELLPTPLSIQKEKADETNILNLIMNETEKPTTPVSRYSYISSSDILTTSPERIINFHHSRNRLKGHSEEGDIFNYESLIEGQVFSGFVSGKEGDLKHFKNTFGHKVFAHVGRSKNIQYGRAEIELLDIDDFKADEIEDNELIITFISPAILLNKFGYPEISIKTLKKYLASFLNLNEDDFDVEQSFAKSETVENFISVWRLKKPLDKAFSAGSTFKINFKNGLSNKLKEKLKALQVEGIGERRNEGFGQIKINWGLEERFNRKELKKPEINKPEGELPTIVKEIFTEIVKSNIKAAVEKEALYKAEEFNKNRLSNSFLGRLELILKASSSDKDFKNKIKDLREKAKEQLKKCRSEEVTLCHELMSESPDLDNIFNNLHSRLKLSLEELANLAQFDFKKDTEFKTKLYKLYWLTFFRKMRKLNKMEERK